MKVLLSIKPEFADKIFSGEKQYEYRKAVFSRRDVNVVVVYASKPVSKIVGEFCVDAVLEGRPSEIWEETKQHSGISIEFFKRYFEGRKKGYAIKIGSARKYIEEIDPFKANERFFPPQSFRYLPSS